MQASGMVGSVQVFFKLNPGMRSDGALVLVDVVWHLLRITEIDPDTSKDFTGSLGEGSLGVDELDDDSSSIDQGRVNVLALFELPVLFQHDVPVDNRIPFVTIVAGC